MKQQLATVPDIHKKLALQKHIQALEKNISSRKKSKKLQRGTEDMLLQAIFPPKKDTFSELNHTRRGLESHDIHKHGKDFDELMRLQKEIIG